MKKIIGGGIGAFLIALIGLLYNMNMLPVTAETLDIHIAGESQKDAQQDLSLYYMQRREVRRDLAEADADEKPDLEEELEQLNDSIDIAKDKLKEKD